MDRAALLRANILGCTDTAVAVRHPHSHISTTQHAVILNTGLKRFRQKRY